MDKATSDLVYCEGGERYTNRLSLVAGLRMASCISNSALMHGWKRSPYSLFGWNIGRNKADDKPVTRYHDTDLSFPISLVEKTFLKGTLSFSLSTS